MTEVEALKAENKTLKDLLKSVTAEKTAIDQMYIQKVKEELIFRTQVVLLQDEVNKMKNEKAPDMEQAFEAQDAA